MERCIPHFHPLDPPLLALITMFLTTTPTNRFGFTMLRGKFCHSCFAITALTAFAQFGHFTLKTRVRFQTGDVSTPEPPSWVRLPTMPSPKILGACMNEVAFYRMSTLKQDFLADVQTVSNTSFHHIKPDARVVAT